MISLGKIKAMQIRAVGYLSIINFIMIFYLYIVSEPLGLKWYYWAVIIFSAIICVLYVDDHFLLSQESGYLWDKIPGAKETQENVRWIRERLEAGEYKRDDDR